ncbi:N-acetylmuramoyl-L-alanine amidase [bacterium]|nr:N-acetylmuramoyl-L-alanine amidase [bacterium]
MKRVIMASVMLLSLVCATILSANAGLIPVRILLGGREAALAPSPVWDGTRVLAPLGILSALGASYSSSTDPGKIMVISSSGKAGEIETVDVNKTKMLPMDKVLAVVGGQSSWDSDAKALNLTALVQSVEFVDETLKVNCSFPAAYTVKPWISANKLIVDIPYARLDSDAREIYIGTDKILRARLGSQDGIARVVLDMEKNVPYKVISDPVASQIQVKVSESLPKPISQQPKSGSKSQFSITGLRVDPRDNDGFDLIISTDRKGSASIKYDVSPAQIGVVLPGCILEESECAGSSSLLKDIKVDNSNPNKPNMTLQLKKVMAYSLRTEESQMVLSVRPPDHSGGKLADKLVVIDPGHGGNQPGAKWGSIVEKDINVKIADELADALRQQGAKVILTRTSDVFMSLAARPEVAIKNNADFFISIHCNSNGESNSASGIETYYHKYEPSPMALAYAVHTGVCAATGMCDRRPRSDKTLYESGLGVLKRLENTGLPGILLECGYLNTAADRDRLLDTNYRKKLASGIVTGLKSYIEGTPVEVRQ